MARVLKSARGFAADRRGNFAILMGVALSVLATGAGFSVNTAQLFNAKSALQTALDAAVTSTARDLTTGVIAEGDARGSIEAFLTANGSGPFAREGEGVVTLDEVIVDRNAKTVDATATANVALAFPLFGADPVRPVSARTAAVYSDQKVEVAMMLDVTGSMSGQKIRDLRAAARIAVEAFLGNQRAGYERVRVSIVPYANSVNAGSLAESSVFVERSVADRKAAPANTAARPVATRPDNCATERKDARYRYSDAGPEYSMVNRDYLIDDFIRYRDGNDKSRTCPTTAIVPLTSDSGSLNRAIDSFKAVGGTGGHIGVQWTWYMLSERWAGVLPSASRPARITDNVKKYAILMTDGEFNLSYFDASNYGQVYNDNGKRQTRDEAVRLCREMKAQGIEIFTIGFALAGENSHAHRTMRECASAGTQSWRYFFDVATGDELKVAFRDIAGTISGLYMSK
ncbi:VWA domain-containing protein [Aliihoeflea aestuarii]|uniref:pilus assembly protein n=1 Tax=Aliihoeflea aestuarii TaxID=453840 RepID=UPI0020937DA5|nr:pilus assembly protein [Aliihoeflea aestuarii]MCO6391420.1 VWA domain-containing protein [Aliihoeflea aestuarii]